MSTPDQSCITHHQGGTTITGRDGIRFYRAAVLRSGLSLFAKTGIRPSHAITPTRMLALAKEYTGKDYKRGQYAQAVEDLDVWIATMKAAMPIVDERAQHG